jgi:hypothetical protein
LRFGFSRGGAGREKNRGKWRTFVATHPKQHPLVSFFCCVFLAFLGKGRSKTPQEIKTNLGEKTGGIFPFFSCDFVLLRFWAFLGEGNSTTPPKTNHKKITPSSKMHIASRHIASAPVSC